MVLTPCLPVPHAGKASTATMPQLLDWMAVADRCQLADLRLACLREVARRLASGSGGLAGAFADAALLAGRCDKGMLVQLVGLLADAASADTLATASAATTALQQAANPGSFEWALEGYSEQPSAVGQHIYSPWFTAAGKEWRFKVFPGGRNEEAAGHVTGEWWQVVHPLGRILT